MCISVEEIMKRIGMAQGEELDEILNAVVLRYEQLLPEDELICLFLPKYDPAERHRILSGVVSLREKTGCKDAIFGCYPERSRIPAAKPKDLRT